MTIHQLENKEIAAVSSLLEDLIDCGDRILEGRVELFSLSRGSAVSCCSDLGDSSPTRSYRGSPRMSPYEPTVETVSRNGRVVRTSVELIFDLIEAKNCIFPDYDFGSLSVDQFEGPWKAAEVADEINLNLMMHIDRLHPGFVINFWRAVSTGFSIDSEGVEAFSLRDGEEGGAGLLWSKDFFFVDKRNRKILFIGCGARDKLHVREREFAKELSFISETRDLENKNGGSPPAAQNESLLASLLPPTRVVIEAAGDENLVEDSCQEELTRKRWSLPDTGGFNQATVNETITANWGGSNAFFIHANPGGSYVGNGTGDDHAIEGNLDVDDEDDENSVLAF